MNSLPNRVDPLGSLFSTPERGLLLGNRGGRFHCPGSRDIRGRPFVSRQWICCRLTFKGRKRQVWGEGYTELFFSDEVAALSAGHRPCFECRRDDATAFAAAWGSANKTPPPKAPEMDAILHRERLLPERSYRKRLHHLPSGGLPDGTMVLIDGTPHALRSGMLHAWTFSGYTRSGRMMPQGNVLVLTPPSIICCLRAGYMPCFGNRRDWC